MTIDGTIQSEQSMYDRIGGAPSVKEAVNRFYVRVLDDPELSPYFVNTDLSKLKQHQAALISQLLGGPNGYSGRGLDEAHLGLGVTDRHYDRVVNHLVAVLVELSVPADIIEALGGIAANVKGQIVTAGDA